MSDLFSILCIAPNPVLLDRDIAVICSVGDACLETFMWILWDNTNDELLGRLDQSVLDTSISSCLVEVDFAFFSEHVVLVIVGKTVFICDFSGAEADLRCSDFDEIERVSKLCFNSIILRYVVLFSTDGLDFFFFEDSFKFVKEPSLFSITRSKLITSPSRNIKTASLLPGAMSITVSPKKRLLKSTTYN
ncbi:hypothetical protein AGLY_006132 [Aphis glycines]|uniref:Uncharacterized protein n=1 Tax=Aphis glycines TaxID=307491 RepID=A0A6G0TTT2_APHGL|nr:hypothetical protein AGLY_006132 [Aphis glycines]